MESSRAHLLALAVELLVARISGARGSLLLRPLGGRGRPGAPGGQLAVRAQRELGAHLRAGAGGRMGRCLGPLLEMQVAF